MASLTTTLPTIDNSPISAINTGGGGAGDFLGGLAKAGAGIASALGARASNQRAEQQFNWEAKDRATADNKTEALNATEVAFNRELTQASDSLLSTKAAVDQGRTAPGALDLKLNSIVTDLYNKYPDQPAAIATYMRANGYDNWRFRELNNQTDIANAARETQQAGEKAAYEVAVSHGAMIPNDYNATIQVGLKINAHEAEIAAAQKAATAAIAAAGEDRAAVKFAQEQADILAVKGVNGITEAKLTPMMNQMTAFIAAAGDDPAKQKALTDLVPLMQTGLETYRFNALGQVSSEAGRKAVNDQIDLMEKSLKDVFTGELSTYQTNSRTLTAMKQQWALNDFQALPLFSRLTASLGASTVQNLFGGDMSTALGPDVVAKIKQEVTNYNPLDPESSAVVFSNIIGIAKGSIDLHSLTPEAAKAALPGVLATTRGAEKDIYDGHVTPDVVERYSNSYGTLLNAAVRLQPGSVTTGSLSNATVTLTSEASRKALAALVANPDTKEQGQALVTASRNTAFHLFHLTQISNNIPKTAQGGAIKVEYNSTKGTYEVVLDHKIADRAYGKNVQLVQPGQMHSTMTSGPTSGPGAVQAPVISIPAALQQTADTLNMNLNHLVTTAPLDPETDSSLTPKQMRDRLVAGQSLAKVSKDGTSADAQFNTQVDAFKAELSGVPQAVITSTASTNNRSKLDLADNNPGNLRASDWTKSQPGFTGVDSRGIAVFSDKVSGLAAQSSLLRTKYFDKGLDTVSGIISKYAPPSENDTKSYISFVANKLGVSATQKLDASDLPHLIEAINQFEGG